MIILGDIYFVQVTENVEINYDATDMDVILGAWEHAPARKSFMAYTL